MKKMDPKLPAMMKWLPIAGSNFWKNPQKKSLQTIRPLLKQKINITFLSRVWWNDDDDDDDDHDGDEEDEDVVVVVVVVKRAFLCLPFVGNLFIKPWHQGLLLVLLILVSWVLVAHAVGEFLDRMVRLEIKNEKAETQHAPRKNNKTTTLLSITLHYT